MKWLSVLSLPILICLLLSCGSPARVHRTDQETAMNTVEDGSSNSTSAADLQRLAIAALSQILRNAASGRYSNVRRGSGNSICGTVILDGAAGTGIGQRFFVIAPAGQPFLSATAGINFSDPLDSFVDAYIRWCASPDELQTLQGNMLNLATEIPDPPDAEQPAEPPPLPAQEPVSRWPSSRSPAHRPSNDSDFFNEVRRIDR